MLTISGGQYQYTISSSIWPSPSRLAFLFLCLDGDAILLLQDPAAMAYGFCDGADFSFLACLTPAPMLEWPACPLRCHSTPVGVMMNCSRWIRGPSVDASGSPCPLQTVSFRLWPPLPTRIPIRIPCAANFRHQRYQRPRHPARASLPAPGVGAPVLVAIRAKTLGVDSGARWSPRSMGTSTAGAGPFVCAPDSVVWGH